MRKTKMHLRRLRNSIAFAKAKIATLNLFGREKEKRAMQERLLADKQELKAIREFLR